MYKAIPGRVVSLKALELCTAPEPPVATPGQARCSLWVLAPIYGWFTEGFDTADLRAARGLLEELASSSASGTLPPTKTAV
jgi:hypothetical protein